MYAPSAKRKQKAKHMSMSLLFCVGGCRGVRGGKGTTAGWPAETYIKEQHNTAVHDTRQHPPIGRLSKLRYSVTSIIPNPNDAFSDSLRRYIFQHHPFLFGTGTVLAVECLSSENRSRRGCYHLVSVAISTTVLEIEGPLEPTSIA